MKITVGAYNILCLVCEMIAKWFVLSRFSLWRFSVAPSDCLGSSSLFCWRAKPRWAISLELTGCRSLESLAQLICLSWSLHSICNVIGFNHTKQTTSYSLLCDIILVHSQYIYDAHDQYFCDNATYFGNPTTHFECIWKTEHPEDFQMDFWSFIIRLLATDVNKRAWATLYDRDSWKTSGIE